MKKSLFVLLIVAVAAAAYFTRPQDPKASFTNYLADHRSNTSIVPAEWTDMAAKSFADSCEYKDRYLWVDVKFDGKTVYTGAFSHWFNRAELKHDFQNGVEKAKDKMDHGLDKVAGK